MARMMVAALAALLLLGCAHQAAAGRTLLDGCAAPKCPNLYTVVWTDTTTCGYVCVKPCFFACPPGPARDPYFCGGSTGKVCPTISCSGASTYAISGPNGCASAKSVVSAAAVSKTQIRTAVQSVWSPAIKQFCDGTTTTSVISAAATAANAFATIMAKTYINYFQFACTCCQGNSQSGSLVQANVQAVANATAVAFADLTAEIDCGTDELVAYAYAEADAFASDVQAAIDSVYNPIFAGQGTCTTTGIQSQMQTAIAKAVVCTFVNVIAKVIATGPLAGTYALGCGSSISATASDAAFGPFTCLLNYCTPVAQ